MNTDKCVNCSMYEPERGRFCDEVCWVGREWSLMRIPGTEGVGKRIRVTKAVFT